MSEEPNVEAVTAEVNTILSDGGALESHVSYNGAWLVSASFPCRGYADDGEGGMSGAIGPKAYAGDTRRTNGDPRELAASFVADAQAQAAKMGAFFGVAPEPEQVETSPHESDEDSRAEREESPPQEDRDGSGESEHAPGDAGGADGQGLGHESDGETGEEVEFAAAPEGGDDGNHTAADADDGAHSPGVADDALSGLEPIDADFDPIEELGAQDELAESDFETLALEGSDLEPEPPAQDGPIAYGASTIDGLIREKLGRVSQIARELKAVLQEGWTVEEYAYLQNLMVRMDRGEAPDDQASRERFLAIAMKSQAMSRIDSVRDRKEGELEEIGRRRDFDAAVYYEPSEGWP